MTEIPNLTPDKRHIEPEIAKDISELPVLEDQESVIRGTGIWASAKRYRWAVACSFLASCGALSEGFQTSLPTDLMVNPGFINQMGSIGLGAGGSQALDPLHITAWTAAYTAAYICGLLLAFLPVDRFGRKHSLYASQALLAIGCTIEVLAKSWTTWLVAKIILGMAVGLGQCAAIAYISEISPTRLRGGLLATYPVMYAFGRFCATIAIQALTMTSPFRYRRVLFAQYFFIAMAIAGLGFIPESPRRLAFNGKEEETIMSLHRLNGRSSPSDVEAEYQTLLMELEQCAARSTHSPSRKLAQLRSRPNMRRVLISSFCLVWSQWLGSKIIFGYNTYFYQLSGTLDSFLPSILLSSITLLGASCSMYLIERVGRRRLLLWSAPSLVGIVLLVGGLTSLPPATATGSALVFLASLFASVHSASIGSVAFAYLGESSSITLRAASISLAAGGAGIANLIVDYCTPLMLNSHHFGLSCTAWIYAVMGSAGLVVCFVCLPETANKSFIDLDQLFDARISARQSTSADEPAGPALVDDIECL